MTPDSETRIGIYADDLTGALDAAAPFAAAGMSTYVSVFGVVPDGAARRHRVLSLNVDTRHGDRFPVFDRAARAAQELRVAGFTLLFNKIDSTLRGHAGMEARAGLSREPPDPRDSAKKVAWAGPKLALIAPSFPAMGRVVRNGQVRVDGVPLAESEVGRDPLSPVSSSDIAEIVEENIGDRPAVITLDEVRECDDLDRIAAAVLYAHSKERGSVILAGSAGATVALARALTGKSADRSKRAGPGSSGKPVLMISGSQRSATARQLELAVGERSMEWVQVDVPALLSEETAVGVRDDTVRRAVDALGRGKHTAVSLLRVEGRPGIDDDSRIQLVRELGAICYRVARRTTPGALVLIGGDTAQSALRAVGTAGIVLDAEPFPGIPAGIIDGGLLTGTPVVTKAGAFGEDGVLVDVIDYLGGA